MKRIGIDFHVVDGKYQGSRAHILELFSKVIAISPELEFFLFLENHNILKQFSPAFSLPNVQIIHMPHSNPIKRLCWQLPIMQKKYQLDWLHTQYILPIPNLSPCLVTIHDILFESHPDYFNTIFKIRSKLLVRWAAKRAKHIFTVSDYSKNAISKRYQVPSEKITVIYNGVDIERFYPGETEKEIIQKYGLKSKSYILSVGRLEPRKNHLTLLTAYAQLKKPRPFVVIIGQQDYGYQSIYEFVDMLGLNDEIMFLNDVSDEDLPAFYRHAILFIYPTWAEGFGMPVLEAMASGTPVISSNTTALTEIVGEAGVLIAPNNIDEFECWIGKLLSDENLSRKMKKMGLQQATTFRWHKSAKILRNFYLTL